MKRSDTTGNTVLHRDLDQKTSQTLGEMKNEARSARLAGDNVSTTFSARTTFLNNFDLCPSMLGIITTGLQSVFHMG